MNLSPKRKQQVLFLLVIIILLSVILIILATQMFSEPSSDHSTSVNTTTVSGDSQDVSSSPASDSSEDSKVDSSSSTAAVSDALSENISRADADTASPKSADAALSNDSDPIPPQSDQTQDETENEAKDNTGDSSQEPVSYPEMIISSDPSLYRYDDLVSDLEILKAQYADVVDVVSLTKTADGRDVYDIIIGDLQASKQILIHGGIHAREYMTSQLVMKQAVTFLEHLASDTDSYQNLSYRELLKDTALHIIPMVNPDGISISQLGLDSITTDEVRSALADIASMDERSLEDFSYLSAWKSNALGVDLNRCFDARWEEYVGTGHPSSDKYKGTMIGDAKEAKALIDLTNTYPLVRTISYHTAGPLIYSRFEQFNQTEETTAITDAWAKELSAATGYGIDENYNGVDAAGYKDWALSKKNIPSVTIEIGSGSSPVDPAQFGQVWEENQNVLELTLYGVTQSP